MSDPLAAFDIEETPYAQRGFDAINEQTIGVRLSASPAPDVFRTRFYVGRKSPDAPDLVFSPADGVAPTPTAIVEVTFPASGAHTYEILSEVNNGKDADGAIVPAYYASRFVAIRGSNGRRKILPAETYEYDPQYGWTAELDAWADEDATAEAFAELSFAADAAIAIDYADPDLKPRRNVRIVWSSTPSNPTITAANFADGREYVIAIEDMGGGSVTFDSGVFRFGAFLATNAGDTYELYIWTFRAMGGILYCVSVHNGICPPPP